MSAALKLLADGGPAFPVDASTAHTIALAQVGSNDEQAYIKAMAEAAHGMTLRDYAAIHFAAALLANPAHHELLHAHEHRQVIAYREADEMLKARSA